MIIEINYYLGEVSSTVRFGRDEDMLVPAELIEGWCGGHFGKGEERERTATGYHFASKGLREIGITRGLRPASWC